MSETFRSDDVELVEGSDALQIRPASQRDEAEVPVDAMGVNELWNFTSNGITVCRADVQGRPIILTKQQLFEIGGQLTVRYAQGGDITFDVDEMNGDTISIQPEELTD